MAPGTTLRALFRPENGSEERAAAAATASVPIEIAPMQVIALQTFHAAAARVERSVTGPTAQADGLRPTARQTGRRGKAMRATKSAFAHPAYAQGEAATVEPHIAQVARRAREAYGTTLRGLNAVWTGGGESRTAIAPHSAGANASGDARHGAARHRR
jgi:hypothetical protein